MDARTLARLQAAGRVGLGAALVIAPGRVAGAWVGPLGRRRQAQVIAAGLGARDVGLGAGVLRALGEGRGARPWILAGVIADATDLAATLGGRRVLPPLAVAGVSAIAGGSVAVGLWALRSLDQPEP